MKRFLTGQYAKFQNKTLVGKILRLIGRIFFGKTVYLTGIDPNGMEFFKITSSRTVDGLFKRLSEEGCMSLNDHKDYDNAESEFKQLRKNRRRG